MAPAIGISQNKKKTFQLQGGFAPLTAWPRPLPLDPAGGQGLKGVFRVHSPAGRLYGWQPDEYKLQNGQMDTLFAM